MQITYIFRAPGKERSIERVFAPIIKQMEHKGHKVIISFAWNIRLWPFSMLANIIRYAVKSYLGGVFHITGDVQYVACLMNPKTTVMTIHDCVMLQSNTTPEWTRKFVYKYWYEKPLKRLNWITCISEKTRQDVISFFPWAANKLLVIPNPVSEDFKYSPKTINEDCPQILHVGTRSNKNLERVIEALSSIECQLHIIGRLTEYQCSLLEKYHIDYTNRFYVSDEEVVSAYKSADIISFPSLFEGFGMPIIEGQSIGRPVLTSLREPMKTVAGENACLVDPESVESIHNGFMRLINDLNYRKQVTMSGLANAEKYNLIQICSAYESIYYKDNRANC